MNFGAKSVFGAKSGYNSTILATKVLQLKFNDNDIVLKSFKMSKFNQHHVYQNKFPPVQLLIFHRQTQESIFITQYWKKCIYIIRDIRSSPATTARISSSSVHIILCKCYI